MYNNFIVFRIYLLIAILILLPICFFVSVELIKKIVYFVLFIRSLYNFKLKKNSLNDAKLLFNYYLKTQQWLKSILVLEFYKLYFNCSIDSLLGICYQKLSYYNIACYYYNQSLNYDENIIVLQNLVLIYRELKNDEMLKKTYAKIKKIDPNNKFLLNLKSY